MSGIAMHNISNQVYKKGKITVIKLDNLHLAVRCGIRHCMQALEQCLSPWDDHSPACQLSKPGKRLLNWKSGIMDLQALHAVSRAHTH